jgi:hypothetical protein
MARQCLSFDIPGIRTMTMIMPQPGGAPPFSAQVGPPPERPIRGRPAVDRGPPDREAWPPPRPSAHAAEPEPVETAAAFVPDGWRAPDTPRVRPALRDVRRVRVMLGVAILASIGLWFLILKGMQLLV